MINNLEGKNKAELIEIINIQIEEYQKLASENAKRDIEQQAKGLSDYSESIIRDPKEIPIGLEHKGRGSNIYNWETHFARELRFRSNKLRNQAKG